MLKNGIIRSRGNEGACPLAYSRQVHEGTRGLAPLSILGEAHRKELK